MPRPCPVSTLPRACRSPVGAQDPQLPTCLVAALDHTQELDALVGHSQHLHPGAHTALGRGQGAREGLPVSFLETLGGREWAGGGQGAPTVAGNRRAK